MLIKVKNKQPAYPGISLLAQIEKANSIDDLKKVVIELVKAVYPIKSVGVSNVK